MKTIAVAVMLASLQLGRAAEVTPVSKVIHLLSGMLEKGKSMKHAEQVQFAAYKQFCDDTSAEKKNAVEEAGEKIGGLKADIQKYTAAAAKLTKEIAELDEDSALWKGDVKAATKVREIEKEDHRATLDDYSESIDALARAVSVLKGTAHDRKQQADSFMQLSALKHMTLVPDQTKRFVDAFLQSADDTFAAAPEANGYEFQSHGVIEMLSKLQDKFSAERTALEKEEANSRHAYEMLVQDLEAQITQADKDRDAKAMTKAKKLEAKGEAFGTLKDTAATLGGDKKYLTDLVSTCDQKANDFESRQQLRSEEIEAVEQAIEIISSKAVSGSAEKHLPTLLQVHSATSFAQLRSSSLQKRVRTHLKEYLLSKSEQLKSQLLLALSARVDADPFTKVKQLIKDLIIRLMEEANEEADHKGWCDKELATNEQTRKEKSEAVETLHADIDELEASSAKLAEDLTELSKAVSELDAAVAKATNMRQEEKAKSFATIKDAMEAQEAVASAVTVLKDFYDKAGEATAFVQQAPAPAPAPASAPPGISDSSYKGMVPEQGGVVGMLEVIASDFARLESDTKAAEATSQKQYDSFVSDSKVDKAEKQQMIEHKTSKAQDHKQALQEKKGDLVGTEKELEAAMLYFEKLKPSCVDAGVSYEDRVQRRREEIESLQEALRIMNGEDIA